MSRAFFRDVHLAQHFNVHGEDAVYTAPDGATTNIRAIVTQPDEVVGAGPQVRVLLETTLFEVRRSELASPAKGGTITFDEAVYTIDRKPELRDGLRLVWTLDVRKADPDPVL